MDQVVSWIGGELPLSHYDYFFFWLFWFCAFFNFSGYAYLLTLIRYLRPRPLGSQEWWQSEAELPELCLIVPTFREERLIEMKLQNLAALDYPREKLRVIVADGQSDDRTVELANTFAINHPDLRLHVLTTSARGKISQLNEALALLSHDIFVVVSDADAEIQARDALKKSAAYLGSNSSVGLVGGWSAPLSRDLCFDAETAFWDKQNRLRFMETVSFSSSIVVAPFYAFRRNLIQFFPTDCLADDVYISFQSHLQDKRVIYDPAIQVVEHRQAASLRELFLHKHRKGLAYCTEILRIAHQAPQMGKRVKLFFGFKLFQILILPWALLGLGAWSIRHLLFGHFALVTKAYLSLLVLMAFASLLMIPPAGRKRGGLTLKAGIASLVIFSMMLAVLLVNCFLFPFKKQGASYRRLRETHA